MIDDYSPIGVGDTLVPFAPQFTGYAGTPFNLSGLTLTLKMENEQGTVKNGSGVWSIVDATNGLAQYAWSNADVNTAGIWTLYISFTNGSGQVAHAQTKTLEIQAVP